MRVVWLLERGLSMREVPPTRVPGEALVRVRFAGICSTDLELVKGYYPYTGIPGHEFVGEVVQSPDSAWIDFSSIVVDEITIVGSRCGPFEPALALLAAGQVDPSDLIAAEFPLEKAFEAFALAAQPGTLKVLVRP